MQPLKPLQQLYGKDSMPSSHCQNALPEGPFLRRARSPLTGLLLLAALRVTPTLANPAGPDLQAGTAVFTQPNAQTLEIQNSAGAVIHWQSFSIGAGETTRFVQPDASSAVLNRVTGGDPSAILGRLQSNGRVFVINPNGILFGADAVVDVAGLVASSLSISNADFLAGRLAFAGSGSEGAVVNQGWLKAGPGGEVVLVAPRVENSGLIEAPDGRLLLAAGARVVLHSVDDDALSFELEAQSGEVLNLGQLIAERGAAGLFARTVRHSGEIAVGGLSVDAAGRVRIVAADDLEVAPGARITANGSVGGTVELAATSGTATIAGAIEATGSGGQGGRVTLTGDSVAIESTAALDASGSTGGGEVLVGGDWQGANPALANARQSRVAPTASLKANATRAGNGGKVVVWSDDTTAFRGQAEARGGPEGGNGGAIEVSGKRNLSLGGTVDASAPRGNAGKALFDPTNFLILGPDAATISLGIQNGTNQEITADNDITLTAPINANPTGPAGALTLRAGRSILLNENITVSSGNGDLLLLANDSSLTATRQPGNADILVAAGKMIANPTGQLIVAIESGDASRPAGSMRLRNVSAGVIEVLSGLLSVPAGDSIGVVKAHVLNGATVELTGGTLNAAVEFDNDGRVLVGTSGLLARAAAGPVVHDGVFDVRGGPGLQFVNGQHSFGGGKDHIVNDSGIADGVVKINGATVLFNAADSFSFISAGGGDLEVNAGSLLINPGVDLELRSRLSVASGALVENLGALRFKGNLNSSGPGGGTLRNFGNLSFDSSLQLNVAVENEGRMGVFNSTVRIGSLDQGFGELFLSGTLQVFGGFNNGSEGGIAATPGARIIGDVFNNGLLEIGNRLLGRFAEGDADFENGVGTLFIDGNLDLGPRSFVIADLGGGGIGCSVAGCSDLLQVSGSVTLDGGLVLLPFPTRLDLADTTNPFDTATPEILLRQYRNLPLITSFRTAVGDPFELLRYSAVGGDFNEIYPVGLPNFAASFAALANSYRLNVTQAPVFGLPPRAENQILNPIIPRPTDFIPGALQIPSRDQSLMAQAPPPPPRDAPSAGGARPSQDGAKDDTRDPGEPGERRDMAKEERAKQDGEEREEESSEAEESSDEPGRGDGPRPMECN